MPDFRPSDLARWTGGRWIGAPPAAVRGVSIDSRAVLPGQLFLAVRGDRFDGHDFVRAAAERGAAAAVVAASRAGDPEAAPLPLLAVEETRRALAAMAAGYRRTLPLQAVAVTGSVGKTTVKELVADVLSRAGPTARTPGNWNNDLGLPLSLLATGEGSRYGVYELGMNHPGELDPLCGLLAPYCGVVTSVGAAHLEAFGSVEEIAREKAAVFRALPPSGLAFASSDGPWFGLLRSYAPCRLVTTSLHGDADYAAADRDAGRQACSVLERATGERCTLRLPLPGSFFVEDALLAVAVGRTCGVSWEDVARAVEGFRGLPLRWQREEAGGVVFVNDAYNANPVSMRAALEAFASMPAEGRKWVVVAGMLELGAAEAEEHRSLGREMADGPWAGVVTVGPRGRAIADGALAGGLPAGRLLACDGAADAARELYGRAAPGDAVLLKASRGERIEAVLAAWRRLREGEEAPGGAGAET